MSLETILGPYSPEMLFSAFCRIAAAIISGAIVGLNRERMNKPAGLRTHILLSLGTSIYVLVPNIMGDMDIGRYVQAVGAIIGGIAVMTVFRREEKETIGITTAVSMMCVSGCGLAAGHGLNLLSVCFAFIIWIVLRFLYFAENKAGNGQRG
jgi:putative Mg2+ transporter-C (MgtC) family protein